MTTYCVMGGCVLGRGHDGPHDIRCGHDFALFDGNGGLECKDCGMRFVDASKLNQVQKILEREPDLRYQHGMDQLSDIRDLFNSFLNTSKIVVERQSQELPMLADIKRDDGSRLTIYDGPNDDVFASGGAPPGNETITTKSE